MPFVPIVPATLPQASPNAQELGRRIVVMIREYQQNHPDTSRTDVRQALKIAELSTGEMARNRAVVIAIVVVLLLLALLVGFMRSAGSFAPGSRWPMIAAAVLIFVALGVVLLIRSSR